MGRGEYRMSGEGGLMFYHLGTCKKRLASGPSSSFPPPFHCFGFGNAIEQFSDADAIVLQINAQKILSFYKVTQGEGGVGE